MILSPSSDVEINKNSYSRKSCFTGHGKHQEQVDANKLQVNLLHSYKI